jgi:hypothetical protein
MHKDDYPHGKHKAPDAGKHDLLKTLAGHGRRRLHGRRGKAGVGAAPQEPRTSLGKGSQKLATAPVLVHERPSPAIGDLSRERRAQRRAFSARWPESGQKSGVNGIPGKGLGRFSGTELAWDAISRDERAQVRHLPMVPLGNGR